MDSMLTSTKKRDAFECILTDILNFFNKMCVRLNEK